MDGGLQASESTGTGPLSPQHHIPAPHPQGLAQLRVAQGLKTRRVDRTAEQKGRRVWAGHLAPRLCSFPRHPHPLVPPGVLSLQILGEHRNPALPCRVLEGALRGVLSQGCWKDHIWGHAWEVGWLIPQEGTEAKNGEAAGSRGTGRHPVPMLVKVARWAPPWHHDIPQRARGTLADLGGRADSKVPGGGERQKDLEEPHCVSGGEN